MFLLLVTGLILDDYFSFDRFYSSLSLSFKSGWFLSNLKLIIDPFKVFGHGLPKSSGVTTINYVLISKS